jgi:hypothetical protein
LTPPTSYIPFKSPFIISKFPKDGHPRRPQEGLPTPACGVDAEVVMAAKGQKKRGQNGCFTNTNVDIMGYTLWLFVT